MVGRGGAGQGARAGVAGRSSGTGRSRPGSSTTRAFPRRDGIRSGWRGNIAANSASRTTAKWRCRCRSPITMRACRWPISCICRKTGRGSTRAGARRACPRRSSSRPSPRSRLSRSAGPARPALPRGVVLMDAGYGNNTELRDGITRTGAALCGRHSAEHHGVGARHGAAAAEEMVGPRTPPTRMRRDAKHQPVSVKELALGLPKRAWHTIKWREGTAERLSSRFARVRVRAAHRDYQLTEAEPEEWLLIEWPEGEKEPTKYWLSTLAEKHRLPRAGRHRQAALAHRARLSGTQAGGRARAFRRPRMARLPPSRHAVHRGLRIPDLREGDDSPLRTSSRRAVPATCRSRRLPTQRRRRCAPNATSQTRSQPCADASSSLSSNACRDAHAAPPQSPEKRRDRDL